MAVILSKAARLNERGRRLSAKGWFAEAEAAYRAAAAAKPQWHVPWYNLALMHKYRGEWRASLDCGLHATDLEQSDEASWWNLGIAATALGNWDVARRAWARCGIAVPADAGPIDMDLGPVPIRLLAKGDGEVVWARRIDPARAILLSVPLPDSGHRWGDLVLHDGAPNGYRMLRGEQVPVFDALACLERSAYVTFVVELDAEPSALELLSAIAVELGGAAEDWSTSTRMLCRECSEGTPGHLHDAAHTAHANPHCGLAARDEPHARQILEAWHTQVPDALVVALRCAPAGTP